MAKKKIRIESEGAEMIPIGQITNFQGDLKSMDAETLLRFAKQIEKNGFSEPISVWKNKSGKLYILDGHQRLAAVKYMAEKMGYDLPKKLPVSYVHAGDRKTAKDMLLGNISQYGKIDDSGLGEFLHETDITLDELSQDYAFSDFNLPKFIEGWKPEVPGDNKPMDLPEDSQKSKIKSVQLFFDAPTAIEVTQMIEALKTRFALESATSTILFCVNRCVENKNAAS